MEEVTALNAGVDGFISRPIRPHVLLTRINVLLRRQGNTSSVELHVNDVFINRDNRSVEFDNRPLVIADSEFELRWYLGQKAGDVVSRDELIKKVRGREYDGLDRSVDCVFQNCVNRFVSNLLEKSLLKRSVNWAIRLLNKDKQICALCSSPFGYLLAVVMPVFLLFPIEFLVEYLMMN